MFFLLNQGRGYTDAGVKQMTIDEMIRHVKELSKMLSEQQKSQESVMKKIKSRQESLARRR